MKVAARRLALISVASVSLVTLSCTSLSRRSDRDPASIAEACSAQATSVDPTKRPGQILFQLQDRERTATNEERLEILEQEFQRIDEMIKKSRVSSFGLADTVDPRTVVVKKALALLADVPLEASSTDQSKSRWNERLYTLEPALRPNPKDEDVQAKAGDLIRIGRTKQGRALLLALSNKKTAPAALRLSARLDLLRSFRFQGSDDEFLRRLELNRSWYAKVFDHSPAAVQPYSNFLQSLIRAHTKKEKFPLAFEEIAALKKFLADEHRSTSGADWMLGRMYELTGDAEKARDAYEATLRALPSDDVKKDQVTWQLGWVNYKLGSYARAEELWADLSKTGSAQVLARNLYWTGRAEAAQGHRSRAADLNRELQTRYPGTFYAPLSAKDLGRKIRPLAFTQNECEVAGRIVARMKRKYPVADAQAFAQLYRQKDLPGAKQFLMDLSLSSGFDSSLLLAAASLGDYQPLIVGFSRLSLAEQNELFEEFPQLLFPNPFAGLITEAAHQNGIEPFFPLSTIRQESVFAPRAHSFADARGLMQVMPQLGVKYASQIGLPNYSTEKLFEPATNIPIGTRHLKEGFEQNHESYILTLAAYNAGDEIAGIWARHLSKDPLEFIEEIPFSETNGYVKAILRNEIYNRALYGDHTPFEYPEALLKR